MNRKGDLSKRFSAAAPKAPSNLERRSGEGTQRDNRDRVWKRMDSRYAPRDDHRENNRHAPRDKDILPPSKEAYNKRRYDDSFAASKHHEEARREERKRVPTSESSKGEIAPEEPETNRSPPKAHPILPPNREERKKKSWYEMTFEEEEEVSKQAIYDKDKPYSDDPELNEVDDPNAEKILEDDDWMIDGENFDDDDLMDEDDLLYDGNHKEEEVEQPMAPQTTSRPIANERDGEKKAEEMLNRPVGNATWLGSSNNHQQPPTLSSQSPFKKKKGSLNPNVAGLSLRKRNMLKGRASPKTKDGPVIWKRNMLKDRSLYVRMIG
ncbi:hypothetical protein F2Q69_00044866 [Brassica cretica]|uniref:Uncharacterized protein n=1 Tax=Brassica cretica TaxID=69181 RepID=A0A8S9NAY2_BRACR|nr:hypothetical protein F2Q69_00044866 [Brassica cretica]